MSAPAVASSSDLPSESITTTGFDTITTTAGPGTSLPGTGSSSPNLASPTATSPFFVTVTRSEAVASSTPSLDLNSSEPGDVQSDHGSGMDIRVAIPLIILPILLVITSSIAFVMWRKSRRVRREKPQPDFPYSRAQGDVEKGKKHDSLPSLPYEERDNMSVAHSFVSDGPTLAPSVRH